MASFSHSEEAFLFSNLRNIINVWSGGSGQARLNISVKDGKAELQLNYLLGHPEESHLPPQLPPTFPVLPLRRRKSKKRQTRDNQRAARYQAAQRAATSSPSSPLISELSTTYYSSSSSTSAPVTTIACLVSQPAVTTTVTSFVASPVVSAVVIPVASTLLKPGSAVLDNHAARTDYPADLSMVSLDSTISTTPYTPWDMPERRFVDCPHCDEDIADHVQPLPCYNCGEWFHHECLHGHECDIRSSDGVT